MSHHPANGMGMVHRLPIVIIYLNRIDHLRPRVCQDRPHITKSTKSLHANMTLTTMTMRRQGRKRMWMDTYVRRKRRRRASRRTRTRTGRGREIGREKRTGIETGIAIAIVIVPESARGRVKEVAVDISTTSTISTIGTIHPPQQDQGQRRTGLMGTPSHHHQEHHHRHHTLVQEQDTTIHLIKQHLRRSMKAQR